MSLDWETLIGERNEWVARNFPPYPGETPGNDSVLGCIEELGELTHAHLKLKQGIRGTPEEHTAAAQDAIGDLIVYLMGVMDAHMSPREVGLPHSSRSFGTPEAVLFALASEVGMLAYCYISTYETGLSTNVRLCINNILRYAEVYCKFNKWEFEGIVMSTWNHVKLRDWNAHRAEGAAKDDPAVKDPKPSDSALGGVFGNTDGTGDLASEAPSS